MIILVVELPRIQAKTEWLAKLIPIIRNTPEMRPKGLIANSFQKWSMKLSSTQAYRAKKEHRN